MTQCPKCRSEKTTQETILDEATCNYCNNTFYPTTLNELTTVFSNSTTLHLPQFSNGLQIESVEQHDNKITIYLNGVQGGYYRVYLYPDHSGKLYREKSGSERNQFGSRWKDEGDIWPTKIE